MSRTVILPESGATEGCKAEERQKAGRDREHVGGEARIVDDGHKAAEMESRLNFLRLTVA